MKRRFSKTFFSTATLLLAAGLCLAEVGPAVSESKRQPKNDKEDVSKIGDRDVGKAVNFYSLEKEIQLGKQTSRGTPRSSTIL